VLLGKGKLHPGCFTSDYAALAALVNFLVALKIYLVLPVLYTADSSLVPLAIRCGEWCALHELWGKEITFD